MRILVDTNVYLDLFLDRNTISKEFFTICKRERKQLFVTSMSLRDIGYISHQYFHSETESKKILLKTYQLCSKVIGISADAAISSIYSDVKDYEDSLIIEAAKESFIDLIITNNIKDFAKSGIPVLSPKDFVNIFKEVNSNLA